MNNFARRMHMRKGLAKSVAVILCVLVGTTLAVASEQGRFEKTLTVSSGADLEVFTRSGDVVVRSGPAGSIAIVGKIHVGDRWFNGGKKAEIQGIEQNPPIAQTGNHVRIDYVNVRDVAIDYEITAPSDTRVHTKSGSGDQTIEGMQAGVEIETGSGDVRLRDLAGDLRVHTGSGNVEARGAAGPIEARAGSGDIRIEENSKGDVSVETGSGNIDVRGVDGGLRVSAGSGDVTVDGKPASSWSVKTGSGNAQLRVPEQAAFDVDISTSSGSVEVAHPVTTTIQGRVQEERKSIRGKVNGGGPEISVHTGSGDVRVD
jgi:hypothetical protein